MNTGENFFKLKCSPFDLERKWNSKITVVSTDPSTLAIAAPAMPILQGNTKTISKTTFRTPPDTTAIMESFGAPSFLTKVCRKVENAKKPSPKITYGA